MGNDSRIDVGVNNHFFRQTWPRCGQRQLSVQHKVDAPYITVIKTTTVSNDKWPKLHHQPVCLRCGQRQLSVQHKVNMLVAPYINVIKTTTVSNDHWPKLHHQPVCLHTSHIYACCLCAVSVSSLHWVQCMTSSCCELVFHTGINSLSTLTKTMWKAAGL